MTTRQRHNSFAAAAAVVVVVIRVVVVVAAAVDMIDIVVADSIVVSDILETEYDSICVDDPQTEETPQRLSPTRPNQCLRLH